MSPWTARSTTPGGPATTAGTVRAIIELSRGHSESRAKSMRSVSNWEGAVEKARQGAEMTPRRKDGRRTRAITDRLPAWVADRNGRLELVAERAAVVRRIFG